ncbi:hypothetical protein KAJ41_02225 [Candidatus Parcubacteria bacterium]|nr:hypothetical protein [Candidatus Parcubacteria bacterium]
MNTRKIILGMLLVILAVLMISQITTIPGEFVVFRLNGVGAGADNITSSDIHGISWTATVDRFITMKVDKEGDIDKFDIELFVDQNSNDIQDNGEKFIFQGPLSSVGDEYSFAINDGEGVRLNYKYLVEKKLFDQKPDKNSAELFIDFGETLI